MAAGPFDLRPEVLGALPIIDHFLTRLGADALIEDYVGFDGRARLDPARALGVVLRALCLSHQPVYALGECAAQFDPDLLALEPDEAPPPAGGAVEPVWGCPVSVRTEPAGRSDAFRRCRRGHRVTSMGRRPTSPKIDEVTVRVHWTDQPYVWHVNDGPEVFVVVDGIVDMHYRNPTGERVERLPRAGSALPR